MATSYFRTNSAASFSRENGSDQSAVGNYVWDGVERGFLRSTWTHTALYLPPGSSYGLGLDNSPLSWVTPTMSLPSVFWTHMQMYVAGDRYSTYDQAFIKFYDSSGVARVMVVSSASGMKIVTRNTAGDVSVLATSGNRVPNYLNEFNVRLDYSASGGLTLYGPLGSDLINFSGDMTTDGVSSIAYVGFGIPCDTYGFNGMISEVLIQDVDTRNCGVLSMPIAGSGVVNTFDTGDYTNVNGLGINDASYLTSLASGEMFLGATAPVVPAGSWLVSGVEMTTRSSASAAGGPQHVRHQLRTNDGVVHDGMTVAPGIYATNATQSWVVNPSTELPWTVSELAGVQIGVQTDT